MDKDWKDSLRERFSDYSVPEPEGLWEGIERGIAGKKRRKAFPVWWVSGGLAAAAAVALAVLLPISKELPVNEPVPVLADAGANPTVTAAEENPEPVPDALPERRGTDVVRIVRPAGSRHSLLAEKVSDTFVIESEDVPETVSETVPETVFETIDNEPETALSESVAVSEDRKEAIPGTVETHVPEAVFEEGTRSAFSIGVFREGGQGAGEASNGYGLVNTGDYLTRVTSDGGSESGGLVRMLSANRASTYEARHRAPVRLGISVNWSFLPWLSVTSGVNWTALSSELEESTVGIRTVTQQDLGYLGIPLRLEAAWHPWKALRLYAGAGPMVETCLLANSSTDSFIGDHWEGKTGSKPDTGGLLWSVGASAGAEYQFSPRVGVYFAPGLEYHFDNGSAVRSAYTEKPLHWNVNLGVRFHFGN